ncbi:hypothetical protein VTJ83DRAFT_1600 [Remersonia thermophila]|uniref:HMG box domain-containing protein n=1 Tax=Remersonia thermophila TaxID=72144 RepID=A0ABR4DGE8_9PEZI
MASPEPTAAAPGTMDLKSIDIGKNPAPLSFIFSGRDMIIQCVASSDDDASAAEALATGLEKFKMFNDGHEAVIIRYHDSKRYCIMSVSYMNTLNKSDFAIVKTTGSEEPVVQTPVTMLPAHQNRVSKVHIRRPRNQFIIYRQWMSRKIHATSPGLTAGAISKIVAKMWQAEKPETKYHFKYLADVEEALHREKYPGYRYVAGIRDPQLPPSKQNLDHDPMTIAERLIEAGY